MSQTRYVARFERRLATGSYKEEVREMKGKNPTHARFKAQGIAKKNKWRLTSFGKAN